MQMDLSIIIPTHQRHSKLFRLLNSISGQNFSNLKVEVLVISNLVDLQLRHLIQEHQKQCKFHIKYMCSEIIGVNAARNEGLKVARSNRILMLDDDVFLLDKDYILKILNYSCNNQKAAAIGGIYALPSKSKLLDRIYNYICLSWLAQGKQQDNLAIHLIGGNTLYHRDVLGHHLKFNENIIFGGSETELNIRIHLSNNTIMLYDELIVEHCTDLTFFSFSDKAIRQGIGRSYHESIFPSYLWSRKEFKSASNSQIEYLNREKTKILFHISKFYLLIYGFFFNVGYHYSTHTGSKDVKLIKILPYIIREIFQLQSTQNLYLNDNDALAYHRYSHPSLRLRKLFHWLKANVFWMIPYLLVWKFINPIKSFITISSINLYHFIRGRIAWLIPYFIKWKIFHPLLWLIPRTKSIILINSINLYHFVKEKIAWMIPFFVKWKVFHPLLWLLPRFMSFATINSIRLYHFIKGKIAWVVPFFLKWKLYHPVRSMVVINSIRIYHFIKGKIIWVVPFFLKWKLYHPIKSGVVTNSIRLYHFIKGKVLWRIPCFIKTHEWRIVWFIKWRLVPGFFIFLIYFFQCHFMFNTIGLNVPYQNFFGDLKNYLKKILR